MHVTRPRFQRFLDALPPWGERSQALFLLAATFLLGVSVGRLLTATREGDRHAQKVQRLAEAMQHHRTEAEAIRRRIDAISQRPTLHQRLDVIEQRLQAIEHRLTP